jgi:predicted negative regulator of RcsB-dependent stress response
MCYCSGFVTNQQEGTVSTTKLTRKEILTEDPVQLTIVHAVDFFRAQGRNILMGVAAVLLISAGVYFGLQYLASRDAQAQTEFTKGLEFYHASIDATAQDDPYGKGFTPTFRTDQAKYEAASKVFASVASKYSFSKLVPLAKYYQGLSLMEIGKKEEAQKLLEGLRNNTKDRTTGYLARKVLAGIYLGNGNAKGAQELVEGMIADPQCALPKEELKIQLAQILTSQGKKDQAVKTLREARDQAQISRSALSAQITQELTRLEGTNPSVPAGGTPIPINLSAPR